MQVTELIFAMILMSHTRTNTSFASQVYNAAMHACAGNPDGAAASYNHAFEGRMSSPDAVAAAILVLKLKGDYEKALLVCSDKGAAGRSDTAQYWCGRILWELGRPGPAARRFEKALALGGSRPWYLAAAAVAHARTGDRTKAVREIRRLLSLSPWLMDSWLWPSDPMGVVLLTEDLFTGLTPADRASSTAALSISCKSYDYALMQARRAWKLGSRAPLTYEVLVRAYGAAYDRGSSLHYLKAGLAAYPGNVGLRYLQAKRYYGLKKWSTAASLLQAVLPSAPGNVRVLSLLGMSYFHAGDMTKARKYLEYARARGAKSADILHAMAVILRKNGKSGPAETLLRTCITKYPGALSCAADLAVLDPRVRELYRKYEKLREKVRKQEERWKNNLLHLKDYLTGHGTCPQDTPLACQAVRLSKKFSSAGAWSLVKRLASRKPLRRSGVAVLEVSWKEYSYARPFFNALVRLGR